ncbi:phosphoribosyl transferase domain protein [Lophiostoma macrostomum CBS 122681]|uniref:Phosphoribosyl transferase domain protein n=1 Tax=Lophiostoma macrostomum CBS 122681 TaxID=1314788 RepID=A0A6A6T7W0_9PLEO|nr:phosphoribosyl transferase domain protein [Lophiostoma macrostomum CBS 122681]
MATLDSLKQFFKLKDILGPDVKIEVLSNEEYRAGFDIFVQESGNTAYREFIIPHISQLLADQSNHEPNLSLLEIGPGPKSVLGYLPLHLRQKVKNYTAYEPNDLFVRSLTEWLACDPQPENSSPLSGLEKKPVIHQVPFEPQEDEEHNAKDEKNVTSDSERYNVILFCHSMYGMYPKRKFIELALERLAPNGIIIVFHRQGSLHLDGLVCQKTVIYPDGVVTVVDNDEALDTFATFIAGFTVPDAKADNNIRREWRRICRSQGTKQGCHPERLQFSAPEIMAVLNQHAAQLPRLTAQVPLRAEKMSVKNNIARYRLPAAVVRPTDVIQVQKCVRWAIEHKTSLTVVGGGHSDQCVWPNVVAVDMSSFKKIAVIPTSDDEHFGYTSEGPSIVMVVEAGCHTGDIIRKSMEDNLTLPLGARPSVGSGLWLQGGIGHMSRTRGLACDSVVGAVAVSTVSGDLLRIGNVPEELAHGSIRPENEEDLLWALKGAGTNFGIVISVTFRTHTALRFNARNWVVPLNSAESAVKWLREFDSAVASKCSPDSSADAYLFWDKEEFQLGVAMIDTKSGQGTSIFNTSNPAEGLLEGDGNPKEVDAAGLFDTEMYISTMHGGHGSGKTSSFKRCVFLKDIRKPQVARRLVAAINNRPGPMCYLHLLHGGGSIEEVQPKTSAFGCRNWDFACVLTGVWPRDQDSTSLARNTIQWVYDVAADLLSPGNGGVGVYGADLGPDPRDLNLATKAFGPNLRRLAHLKHVVLDPHNILAYACPLPSGPKLVILVTGDHGAGKDYCAKIWVSCFINSEYKRARVASISDETKRAYAEVNDVDMERLLHDRAYKEKHRPLLTAFFEDQMRKHPDLPKKHFLQVVNNNADVDVLLITGMRDEAPVAAFSNLVPETRLIEVHVTASFQMLHTRRGIEVGGADSQDNMNHRPTFNFTNNTNGHIPAESFAKTHLLHLVNPDLQRLASMVRSIPNYPRPSIDFQHVLNIAQTPGGLPLCTSLLQSHFAGSWGEIDAIVSCEAGGFVYASALALQVNKPLILIREAGKLPPPTVSVRKSSSYISSLDPNASDTGAGQKVEKRIEMNRGMIPGGASIIVVDDVLSTGETLCAVLQLLGEAGVGAEDVSVMVVAEFPVHRGRETLRKRGFGRTGVQSLSVYGGA